MLTIENVQRLKGKVIGQTGYYVESIKPVVLMDTKTLENTHWYMIELTNRKQFLMLQLDRTKKRRGNVVLGYRLWTTDGKHTYIHKNDIPLWTRLVGIVYKNKMICLQ